MKQNLSITLLALALLFASVPIDAQDESPPNVAELWVVTVDYPNAAAFEEAFKKHVVVREAAEDPRDWSVYTTAAGDGLDEYYIYYCCFDWADADAYEAWTNSSGVMGDWFANVAPHIDDYRHQYSMIDTQNSNWNVDINDYRFIGVTSWTPKPEAAMSMNSAISALSAVGKENGWADPWSWSYNIGGPNQLHLASPYSNYAEMAPPEQNYFQFVAEHLGMEEAVRLFNEFGNSFWGSSYKLYMRRADLSMGGGED